MYDEKEETDGRKFEEADHRNSQKRNSGRSRMGQRFIQNGEHSNDNLSWRRWRRRKQVQSTDTIIFPGRENLKHSSLEKKLKKWAVAIYIVISISSTHKRARPTPARPAAAT